jgi:hypothetical protein
LYSKKFVFKKCSNFEKKSEKMFNLKKMFKSGNIQILKIFRFQEILKFENSGFKKNGSKKNQLLEVKSKIEHKKRKSNKIK